MTHPLPPLVTERLRALRERPVEPVEKGCGGPGAGLAPGGLAPGGLAGSGPTAAGLAAARPELHGAGFTYPLLTLRETALAGNIAAMAAYCAEAGVALAPHGKTAMSPELAARQLAHGAWGITVATIGQLRTYRAFGFPRLLLANELVDEAGIAWLAAELAADPGFEVYCYVDSAAGVRILDRVLSRYPAGRRLPVLVEIGAAGGRTGCRTDAGALAVARSAAATNTLELAGVAGYEGSIAAPAGDQGGEAGTLEMVTSFCRRLRTLAGQLSTGQLSTGQLSTGQLSTGQLSTGQLRTGQLGAGDDGFIVTAGGSAYFDVVTRELTAGDRTGITAILRSGAYLTHDHGFYAAVSPAARGSAPAPGLRPALELWAQVLSRPEAGLALLGAGRRDAGFDQGLPVPLRAIRRGVAGEGGVGGEGGAGGKGGAGGEGGRGPGGGADLSGSRLTELNDQHAYLQLGQGIDLAPGDLVCLGISHPCTTLDKWRVIPLVSDDGHVTDMVHAFF